MSAPIDDDEIKRLRGLCAVIPAGPYQVYVNYEGGLEIVDGQERRMLADIYAYDVTPEEQRMDATAQLLNAAPAFLDEVERLRKIRRLAREYLEEMSRRAFRGDDGNFESASNKRMAEADAALRLRLALDAEPKR